MARARGYRRLKRTMIVVLTIVALFMIYVEIANRNSKNMSYRQKVLKAVYPVWMWFNKIRGKNTSELSSDKLPAVSFYSLKSVLNNGDTLEFSGLKGKKVLIVNTASDCGYTRQYADLQELFEQRKDKLVILAFPANDFKKQEKGSDEEIAKFCQDNYKISFPLMKKSVVVQSASQNPVFRWLTDPKQNGWNSKLPEWNFSKYLVDEEGRLTNYFGAAVPPFDKDVIQAIEK